MVVETKWKEMETRPNFWILISVIVISISDFDICLGATVNDFGLTATGLNNGVEASFDVTLSGGNLNCLFDWDTEELDIIEITTATDVYSTNVNESGWRTVTTTCVDNDTVYLNESWVYIGDSITSFKVTEDVMIPFIYPITADFVHPVTYATGSHVTINVTKLDTGFNMLVTNDEVAAYNIVLPISEFPVKGIYAVDIHAYNPLSDLLVTIAVVVLEAVNVTDVSPKTDVITSNTEFNVAANVSFQIASQYKGDDVIFTWHILFANTPTTFATDRYEGAFCDDGGGEYVLNITLVRLVGHIFRMEASNFINYYSHTDIAIGVYYAMNEFTVVVSEENHEQVSGLAFDISTTTSASEPMGNLTCTIDYGDGSTPQIELLSEVGKSYSMSLPYTYDVIGHYIANITCQSEPKLINDDTVYNEQFYIRALNLISSGDVLLDHDSELITKHPYSVPLGLTVYTKTNTLPNITCWFNITGAQDLWQEVKGDVTAQSNITTKISFPVGDEDYVISVKCFNEISTDTIPSLSTHIYYDCWKSKYFDDVSRQPGEPKFANINENFIISAQILLTDVAACVPPLKLSWKLYDDTDTVDVTNQLTSPLGQQFLMIPKFTYENKLYKAELTTSFDIPDASMTDYTYVQFLLPDLVATITDGVNENQLRHVKLTDNVVLDSSASYDPAQNPDGEQAFLASTPLTKTWTCKVGASYVTEQDIITYYMTSTLPTGFVNCQSTYLPGGANAAIQEIPPNTFLPETYYVYEVTYTRGSRSTSATQSIIAHEKTPLNLKLFFIKNDHKGKGLRKKLRAAELELNYRIEDDVDNSTAISEWKFMQFNTATSSLETIFSAKDKTGFKVPKEKIEPGVKYLLSCTVSLPDNEEFGPTTVYQPYIGNYPPRGPKCVPDKTTVSAAIEDVCFTCQGIIDEYNNEEPSIDDKSEMITIAFEQVHIIGNGTTRNTSVANIPLSSGVQTQQCFSLSQPMDYNKYTMVEAKIYDYLQSPFIIQQFQMTVNPILAASITGVDGVATIENVTNGVYESLSESLGIGDTSMVTSKVAALASVFTMGGVEVVGAMPDEVDEDAAGLGDIKEDGTVVTADEAFNDLKKHPEDETAIAIRKVKSNLASYLNKAQSNHSEEQQEDPVIQLGVIKAAAALVTGSENGIDTDGIENVAAIYSKTLDRLNLVVDAHGNSEETINFLNGLIEALGQLSATISPDSEAYLLGVKDMADSRNFMEQLEGIPSSRDIEKADMTRDERIYLLLKKQIQISVKSESRINLGVEQRDRVKFALSRFLLDIKLSDGSVNQYGADVDDPQAVLTMTKDIPAEISKKALQGKNVKVKLPGLNKMNGKVTYGMFESKTPTNRDSKQRFADIKGREVIFEAIMDHKVLIPFKETIEITFPVPQSEYNLIEFQTNPEDADALHRMQTFVGNPDDMVCIENKPMTSTVESFDVFINCKGDVNKINFDAEDTLADFNSWKTCFEPNRLKMKAASLCKYGFRANLKKNAGSPRKKRAASNSTSSAIHMNMTVATMACMVYTVEGEWVSDRCSATWMPDRGELVCNCIPARKMTFANSFYVPPNTIDFSSVFLKFSPLNQAAVMGTLAAIFVVYVLVVVWARRKDRKDLLKWGITPLSDNFPEDNYFYVVKVFTGMRPGAGTKSRVGFVMAGEEMDTGVRELSDGVRKEFRTGSVMNFLMSTTVYMGDLEYIRLWHDNSGSGNNASWYLSKIVVQDVQRNETFTFMVERWLAVEKEDGMLECVVPVAKTENLNVFKNRFFMNAKENLAESHIWVSVMYRPQTSHFTRVQRATCALVFLMLTMISNAMFFRGEENYETPAAVKVGPFRFTMQQLYISLICALITTPATMVIIYLFKLARPKPFVEKSLFPKTDRSSRYKLPGLSWYERQQQKSMELEESLIAKGYPSFEGCSLPSWFNTLAWILSVLCVLLCSFFIMLYSMEWGKQKSEEWLTVFFLTFFESVFCLDPIKVAVMALAIALLVRSAQDSKSVIDRNTIMKNYKSGLRGKSGGVRLPAPPLDKDKLSKAKTMRTIEIKMKTAVKDVLFNIFIIWIMFSLSFSTRDSWSYNMHEETVGNLLSPPNKMSFYDIKTINEYFDWLNNTAIMNMFPEEDLQGNRLHWRHRQFIEDGAKFRVGPPRLRQVRTTEKSCKIPFLGEEHCYKKYYEATEETGSFCIGWNSTKPCNPDERAYMVSSDAWKFTSAIDIWGFPISGYYTTYGGGGYIAKLSVNREISHLILKELYDNSWVDRQTRAVILEFTLYSLNTNIFTYNVFMAEFPETGGVFSFVMILPLRVYMHLGAIGLYTIACEVIFLIYLTICTIMAIIGIVQQKKGYFKKPWQVFDLVFIGLSYIGIVMYCVRMYFSNQSLSVFKEDKKAFVNFFHIALWDQVFVLLVGVLVFMSVLRLLNTFGYNKRIGAVAQVFSNAATELIWFGIFFLNIFMCYAVFGTLLFGSKLRSYKNIYKTMGTLFISMIGKSRFTEIEETDPIMSKIYFMIFVFFVVYMILTMFLAVLSRSIDQVHENVKKTKSDEMVDYAIKKFKGFLSFKSHKKADTTNNRLSSVQPSAPWSVSRPRGGQDLDNRAILEDIRMSLNQAILMDPSMEEKARGAPKPKPLLKS